MKKVFSLVLAMLMFTALLPAASAAEIQTGTCGADLTWTLDKFGTLTVSGTGEMKDYYIDITPWATGKIKKIVIEEGVTSVGMMAFYGCDNLKTVSMPKSVERIESDAFKDCEKLENVSMAEGVESIGASAFQGCTALKEIHIPEGVTSIGEKAFYGCENLREISIPESAKNIEKEAFLNTAYYNDEKNWESGVLYIGNALIKAKSEEVNGKYDVKEGTSVIANGAFSECGALSGVDIPESVKSVGAEAFYNCENLRQVNVLGEAVKIGDYAFRRCKELSNIELKGDAVEVGNHAFFDTEYYRNDRNWADEALYLGTALIAVEKGKMSGEYTVKEGTTVIADGTFYNCIWLTGITIPKSVTYIGEEAFGNCGGLTDINVESGCENYESREGVLFGKGLTSLIRCPEGKGGNFSIPSGVVKIEMGAFSNCVNLKGVTIPEGVKEIGESAFAGAYGLTNVYYEGTEEEWKAIKIKDDAFGYMKKPKIYYSCGSDGIRVYLNGKKVEFDQEPVILEGRTLVPVRAVVEAMGGGAEWDDESKTAALRFEKHEIKLTAGSTTASLDGETKTLDKAPEIIGERMLIPIRFVAEGFGFNVYWDTEIKSVFIEGKFQ